MAAKESGMEMAALVPLLSGFAGAVIGAGTSVLTVMLQTRKDDRREKVRLAVEIAKIDHQFAIDMVKMTGRPANVMPLPIYIAYYTDLLTAIGEDSLTPEQAVKIREKNRNLGKAFDE
jgi:hypothetical protein